MARRIDVYDFLYVDAPRIRSLISQLHDLGILLEHIETDELESGLSGSGEAHGASAGLARLAIDASANVQGSASRTTRGSQQRRYDPQYALPIDLIDLLEEEEMIRTDVSDFKYGAIASFEGRCFAMDFSVMENAWGSFFNGSSDLPHPEHASGLAEYIKATSPTVISVIHSAKAKVWSSLLKSNWLIPPANLSLSHGSHISGDLTILGVVDAVPDRPGHTDHYTPDLGFAVPFTGIATEIRKLMGRPTDCFGFLPLIVYRKIARKR